MLGLIGIIGGVAIFPIDNKWRSREVQKFRSSAQDLRPEVLDFFITYYLLLVSENETIPRTVVRGTL